MLRLNAILTAFEMTQRRKSSETCFSCDRTQTSRRELLTPDETDAH